MQIAIAEAKANLAELIRRAEAGEEIELTRYGRPVARIVGAKPEKKNFVGFMEGEFELPDDFLEKFKEADAEIEALFYGDGTVDPK